MTQAKEEVKRILEKLPENATLEEIQHQISLQQPVKRMTERALSEDQFDVKITEWMES